MTKYLQAIVFAPDSRYVGNAVASHTDRNGRTFEYLLRRRIPRPPDDADADNSTQSVVVPVMHGDRPDLLAARALGDPTLFWHLCDTNDVIDPEDLTTPGRAVVVTPLGTWGS
jgi:hypothetical protein